MVFIVTIVKWINQQTSAQTCGPDYGVTEWPLLFLLQEDHDLQRNNHPGFGFVENLGIPLVQNHFNGVMMIFASD